MHQCQDCGHSFFVPGTSGPMLIQGGCPECGGTAGPAAGGLDGRPERDQPSGVKSDGELRNMPYPDGQDTGGNPLQEGILGQTDDGWSNPYKRDESFASVRTRAPEYVTPTDMFFSHLHPQSSNQTPQLPWEFALDEVAPPGIDNEDAEEIMEKKAFLPALAELAAPLLEKAAPQLMRGALFREGENAVGMGGGGGGGAPQPSDTGAEPDLAPASYYASTDDDDENFPGGGTAKNGPHAEQADGDPEDVDFKEKNDGEDKGTPHDQAVDDIGGSNAIGDKAEDVPMTPGLESLQMLLPLLLHYHNSPTESGLDHPLISALHDLLGQEGRLDGPDDPEAVQMVIEHVNGKGKPEAQTETKESANHQGPHSPEQIASVQQLLLDQGRTDEVPLVPLKPWEYGDEMAEVANRTPPPQDMGNEPQPAQEEAPPEATMPMPGMSVPQGGALAHVAGIPEGIVPGAVHPEEEALQSENWPNAGYEHCPHCGAMAKMGLGICPQCHREVYQNGAAQDLALDHQGPHFAADGATEPCPECGSHTTGALTEDGSRYCSRCKHKWKRNLSIEAAEHHEPGAEGNPLAVSDADQDQPYDPAADQDSSHQWQTSDGAPLVQGQMYELHMPGVEIPDVVRVTTIKPNAVELEFTGAYQLGFRKEISREEFQLEQYSFTPIRGTLPPEETVDPNKQETADYPTFSGPGSSSDLSQPHQVMTSWHIREATGMVPGPAPQTMQPPMPSPNAAGAPQGTCPKCGAMLQMDGSCAGCERGPGAATQPIMPPSPIPQQNMAMPGSGASDSLTPDQQRFISRLIANAATDPGSGGDDTAAFIEEVVPTEVAPSDLAWLNDGLWDSRTAGAHYSPSQQRELIDEDGEARNADKLDLSDTHYETRHRTAPDDDFIFGL